MDDLLFNCGNTDCFAYLKEASACRALKGWVTKSCAFYKTKIRFYEENDYLTDDEFTLIFGRTLLKERKAYQALMKDSEGYVDDERELQQDND